MEKYEIKSFGLKSIFKVSIYFMTIPMALFSLIGLFMAIIGGITGELRLLFVGIFYIIIFIFMIPFNALIYMLIGAIYNMLAIKFGGLELQIEKK